ncbi:MAG: 50S ribosomal protein L22 [Candidatus Woesearchaeota archaeon]
MAYAYSGKMTENSAKAVGLALPISRKQSTQVCAAIRGLNVQKAKKVLEDAIALKKPIAMKKYNRNTGHKAGIGPGSYAPSTCSQILKILKNAEANAQFKGLSTSNLIITHASAQKGPTVQHYGRQRTKAKRTHIELVLEEIKQAKEAAK